MPPYETPGRSQRGAGAAKPRLPSSNALAALALMLLDPSEDRLRCSRYGLREMDDSVEVPASLRLWFVVHAVVDVAAAVPLIIAPEAILPRLGWTFVDPVAARLVGAALAGIGVTSWRTRHASAAVVRALVGLKVVWSASAILALVLAIGRGAPQLTFLFLSIFLAFCGVWSHHAIRFRQLARASSDAEEPEVRDLGDGPEEGG